MSFHLSYTGDEVQSLLEKAGTALQEHQDLSDYYTKEGVDDAILEETIRAINREEDLEILIGEVQELAEEIQSKTNANESTLGLVAQEVEDVSLILSEVQEGLSGRLTKIENLVGGGSSNSGLTILERVDANDAEIKKLKTKTTANEQAISLLNNNANTKGSVDYKIQQALAWTNIG